MSISGPDGTIDITNLVASLQSTFIKWADTFVYGELLTIPYMQWVALPVVSWIVQSMINWIVSKLVGSAVLEAFFINTAIRKASQAQDYVTAKDAVTNASPDIKDADYEALEKAEVLSFRNFVLLTN